MSDRITRNSVTSTPDGLVITVEDYVDVDATDKVEKTVPKELRRHGGKLSTQKGRWWISSPSQPRGTQI